MNIEMETEFLLKQFFHNYTELFTAEDFLSFVKKVGIKASIADCIEYLESNNDVYAFENGTFATRACLFTDYYFSFKPLRQEIDEKSFIVGDRCVPFLDPAIYSFGAEFFYKGKELEFREIEIDSSTAVDRYSLFGDEYVAQYISQDPANSVNKMDMMDYALPPRIRLSSRDLKPLLDDGLSYGDRILAHVTDWANHKIELEILKRNVERYKLTDEDLIREQWYCDLERGLLDSFDRIGPLGSIEEQLAVVFIDNRKKLNIRECGSVSELFSRTTKIGFQLFGVETRLWFKGKDVPAVGKWNGLEGETIYNSDESESENKTKSEIETADLPDIHYEPAQDFLVDAYLKDIIYREESSLEEVCKKLYPNFHKFSKVQRKALLLNMQNRHAILLSEYNKFVDFSIARLRHRFLDLFANINALVYAIDMAKKNLKVYPQQSLVILTQLYTHSINMIEMAENDTDQFFTQRDELDMSLEGMEDSFEYVSEDLQEVLAKDIKYKFKGTTDN